MNINKLRLLIVCLLATLIMSGLVTPIGLLTESAAGRYGVAITVIASQFSWFIGGVFIGYIVSFFVFDYFSMKQIIVSAYVISISAISVMHFIPVYGLLAWLLVIIGICASIVACAASTLITRLWQGKIRHSVLVAQDAMFNGGGVLFTWIATYFVGKAFAWSATWMVVGGFFLFVSFLAFISSFREGETTATTKPNETAETEWNAGFILIGISLLLFLFAKISLFIWAPQYVERTFSVGGTESGRFMSNIFTAAFLGSVAGTWIVSKINVKYLLYSLVLLAVLSTWLLAQSETIETMYLLGFIFGISVSATYNSYVAFGLTFVAVPTHRHIAYLSVLSSKAVEMQGEASAAMMLCTISYVIVFLVLVAAHIANTFKYTRQT